MYSVPEPGYDLATMRAVAMAYCREREAGRLDQPARETGAVAVADVRKAPGTTRALLQGALAKSQGRNMVALGRAATATLTRSGTRFPSS